MLTWLKDVQRGLRAGRRDNTIKVKDGILRIPKERITSWEEEPDSEDIIIFVRPDPRILEFFERFKKGTLEDE